MDADDWLKSIEKKLQVVQCNNREKAHAVRPAGPRRIRPEADLQLRNSFSFSNMFYRDKMVKSHLPCSLAG
jgi:hypothetical protein